MHPAHACTLNSPAFLHSPTWSAPAPPLQCVTVSTIQAYGLNNPQLAWQQVCQSLPILLSLILAHVTVLHSRLPVLTCVLKRFSASSHSTARSSYPPTTPTCASRLAGTLHLAALVTQRAYPHTQGAPFMLALRLMRALSALTRQPPMQSCSP